MPLSLVSSSLDAVAFLTNLLLQSLPFFRISLMISFSIFYYTYSSRTPTLFYLSTIFYCNLCMSFAHFSFNYCRLYPSYPTVYLLGVHMVEWELDLLSLLSASTTWLCGSGKDTPLVYRTGGSSGARLFCTYSKAWSSSVWVRYYLSTK